MDTGLAEILAIVSFISTAWGIYLLLSPPADDKWRNVPILIGIGVLLPTIAVVFGIMPISTLGIEVLLLALFTLLVYIFYYRWRVKIEGLLVNVYYDKANPGSYLLEILKEGGGIATVRAAHHEIRAKADVGARISVEVPRIVISSIYPTAFNISYIER